MSQSIKQLGLLNQGQPLAHMIAPECASEDLLNDMRVHVEDAISGAVSENEFRSGVEFSIECHRRNREPRS